MKMQTEVRGFLLPSSQLISSLPLSLKLFNHQHNIISTTTIIFIIITTNNNTITTTTIMVLKVIRIALN
jgi:hypothetical protein